MRVLRISKATGEVVNAETWNALPPETDGHLFVASDEGGPRWTYIGGELSPPETPPPDVPYRISRMQGRRQLKAEGLLSMVEGQMALLEPDDDVRMTYEDASHWHRDHEFIAQMALLLDKDEAEVDEFFIAASLIR